MSTFTVRNTTVTLKGILGRRSPKPARDENVWQVLDGAGEVVWPYLKTEEQAQMMAEALNSGDTGRIHDAEDIIRHGRVLTQRERASLYASEASYE